jgi:hypothetical protein
MCHERGRPPDAAYCGAVGLRVGARAAARRRVADDLMCSVPADRSVLRARWLLQLDLQPQVVHAVGVAQRVFVGDVAASYRSNSAWSKVCMPSSRLRFISSLISADLALEDQVADQRRVEHDLHRGDAAAAFLARQQALR